MVASLGLGTTGAAYHHLKGATGRRADDWEERGIFEIAPEQVGFVVGILSALATEATVESPNPVESPDGEVAIEA